MGTTYVPYAMLTVSNGDASEVTAGTEFTYGGLSCLPPGWTYQNIGGSEADGRSSYADGVFTIHGSGTDIRMWLMPSTTPIALPRMMWRWWHT